jgi:hypothetical protein
MIIWTLEYEGATKTFAEWGITGVRRSLVSQAPDIVTFSAAEKLSNAAIFLYENKVTIYRTEDDGAAVTWFVGWVEQAPQTMNPTREGRDYKILGPWRWLDRLVLQRPWYRAVDPTNSGSDVVGGYRSTVVLNLDINGAIFGQQLSTAEQVTEIIDYVNLVNSLQATIPGGDIIEMGACPVALPPFSERKDITCGEAIRHQLRWLPAAVTMFDYTEDPPRLNILVPSTVQTVDMAECVIGGVSLTPREDRQVSRVRIKYEQENTVNNVRWNYELWDVYPEDGVGTGNLLAASVDGEFYYLNGKQILKSPSLPVTYAGLPPDNDFNELLLSFSLSGWTASYAQTALTTEVWGTQDWLIRKLPFLRDSDATLRGFRLKRLYYPDGSYYEPGVHGFSPALLYDIIEGAIMDGLRNYTSGDYLRVQEYSAVYEVSHTRGVGDVKTESKSDIQTIKFMATDAPSGYYSGMQSFSTGDPVPIGTAQILYDHLNKLQHDGAITLKKSEIDEVSLMGKQISIEGDGTSSTWQEMTVQRVDEVIESGDISVTVGVPPHLSAGDMVELLRVSRHRGRMTAPNTIQNGQSVASSQASIRQTSNENSLSGPFMGASMGMTSQPVDSVTGLFPPDRVDMQIDTPNGKISLKGQGTAPSATVKENAEVELDLAKAESEDAGSGGVPVGRKLEIRELSYCDEGEDKKILVLASAPYIAPAL